MEENQKRYPITKEINVFDLFKMYPSAVNPSTQSIIFIHSNDGGYDPREELDKEIKLYKSCLKRLDKKTLLLSGDFSNKAPKEVFDKECRELCMLEEEVTIRKKKIILLSETIEMKGENKMRHNPTEVKGYTIRDLKELLNNYPEEMEVMIIQNGEAEDGSDDWFAHISYGEIVPDEKLLKNRLILY